MKKFFFNLFSLLLLTTSVAFTSCSDDDDAASQKISVRFEAAVASNGAIDAKELAGMQVTFTEVRNSNKTTCKLDNEGVAIVDLYKGTYDVSIEETTKNGNEEIVVALRIENLSISEEGQQIKGQVFSAPKQAVGEDFIFSEIFFNGERNSGKMMHPDQYIVVYNPTVRTLYADGLSIAVTQHLAWQDKQMWYDEYYNNNKIPVGGFITVPGNGKDHPVAPGERFVIAFTAIDHSKTAGYDHAVDLSGADYEIFYGPESNDIDNPEVENVLLTENGDSFGFFFQPRGYVSPLMFRIEDGTKASVEKFLKENTSRSKTLIPANEEKGTPEEIVEINIVSVPTAIVIDGVQTSDVPQDVKTRVIPETIDRGKFLVNGCHRQELAIRKTITVNGKSFYKDTNNSSVDFEDVNKRKEEGKVQNAFPKGWRNK